MRTEELLVNLCDKFDLDPDEVNGDTVIFQEYLDSMDMMKFAEVVEIFAKKHNVPFDLVDFFHCEAKTINDVITYLKSKK